MEQKELLKTNLEKPFRALILNQITFLFWFCWCYCFFMFVYNNSVKVCERMEIGAKLNSALGNTIPKTQRFKLRGKMHVTITYFI